MRVIFYTLTREGSKGGIERLIGNIANYLVTYGVEVLILGDSPKQHAYPYPLDHRVHFETFEFGNKPKQIVNLRNYLQDKNPDIVVVMRTGSWVYFQFAQALKGSRAKLVLSEHASPESAEEEFPRRGLREILLHLADSIHLLQPHYTKSLPIILLDRTKVIGNPIKYDAKDIDLIQYRKEKPGTKQIVMVGRLTPKQKRPRVLLRAFHLIHEKFPDWTLHFCGDGPEVPILKQQIEELKLTQKVFLEGQIEDVSTRLRDADIFALPSCYEGLPIALIEAMAKALPCVVFAEAQGSSSLIEHGVTGVLAQGIDSAYRYADALASLMKDEDLREKIGGNAFAYAKQYDADIILNEWLSYLKTLAEKPKKILSTNLAIEQAEQAHDEAMLRYYVGQKKLCNNNLDYSELSLANIDDARPKNGRSLVFYYPNTSSALNSLYTSLLPKLSEYGFNVCVVLGKGLTSLPFSLPNIETVSIAFHETYRLASFLAIRMPEALYLPCSHSEEFSLLYEALRLVRFRVPVILADYIDSRTADSFYNSFFRRDLAYAGADFIHLLRDDQLHFIPKWMSKKTFIIPPILAETMIQKKGNTPAKSKKTLAFCGTLDVKSGATILFEALSYVLETNDNWEMLIIGQGPIRSDLHFFAKYYNLSRNVHFKNDVAQFYELIPSIDLFVYPSYADGYPLHLAEAMLAGIPGIGFASHGGADTLIEDGVNGILIQGHPDARTLANVILKALADENQLAKYAEACKETRITPKADDIITKWLDLINQATKQWGKTALLKNSSHASDDLMLLSQYHLTKGRAEEGDLFPETLAIIPEANKVKKGAASHSQAFLACQAYTGNKASKELLAALMLKPNFTVLFEFEKKETDSYFRTIPEIFNIKNLVYYSMRDTVDPATVDAVFIMIPHPRLQREVIVKWAMTHKKPLFILEAGLISSLDLMANFDPPLSYNVDFSNSIYLASDSKNSITEFLNSDYELNELEKLEAETLQRAIIANDISKYNLAYQSCPQLEGQKKVLVIDQSFRDWSIIAAECSEQTFNWMLAVAIAENPDALIYVKVHPDALAGKRASNINVADYKWHPRVRLMTENYMIGSVMDQVDKVYAVCSTLGFEAALRGKDVVCFGKGFYAGWGFTDDRVQFNTRKRKRALIDVIFAMYIRNTYFLNFNTRKPTNFAGFIKPFLDIVAEYRKSPDLYLATRKDKELNLKSLNTQVEANQVALMSKVDHLESRWKRVINRFIHPGQ